MLARVWIIADCCDLSTDIGQTPVGANARWAKIFLKIFNFFAIALVTKLSEVFATAQAFAGFESEYKGVDGLITVL